MRLLTAVSGVRVPQQAPSSPQGELRNTSRNSAGCLHVCLRLLFASQKCETFAVLLVPAELSRRSLIFAPRGGFAAVSFLFLSFSSNPLTLLYPTKHTFCGGPGHYPTENTFGGDSCLMPSVLVTAENVFLIPHDFFFPLLQNCRAVFSFSPRAVFFAFFLGSLFLSAGRGRFLSFLFFYN